ncbi:decaprenyl-phosphate phosphoribosyltransferase [Spirochaetia bacterium]|nr:decaprenyl-phosphate phosphoribosyltransferase [Spirochaetia bacterium]
MPNRAIKNIVITAGHYGKLLRLHHYIKNILVFVPLFFSLGFFEPRYLFISCLGFVVFSLLSSIVYILNDIKDIEKDRLHTTKRLRPLVSGKISIRGAIIAMSILSIVLVMLLLFLTTREPFRENWRLSIGMLLLYMLLNIGYSLGLKNIPLVDVTILAGGYVIRVLFGALIINIDISIWLYLMITMGAYYLGLGKRRNEITANEKGTRTVMRFYSHNFLDKNMYMCQTLCIVFYSLWSIDPVTIRKFHTTAFVYTIPVVLFILLKYSLNIETGSDGDPTSVVLHDKVLLFLSAAYIVCAVFIIYVNRSIG